MDVSKRLYNDSIIRNNKRLEKEINNKSKNSSLSGKHFNNRKYIELYEDSKLRKEKNECAIPMNQLFFIKKNNIRKNFKKIERNQKNIENKSFNKIKNNKGKYNKINNLKKVGKNKSCKIFLMKNNKKENKDSKDN